MKVDGSVKSLIQGVSQQPRQMRFPGQCSLQENMSSNPLTGLTRRPPLKYLSNLVTTSGLTNFFEFNVNSIRYHAVVTPGTLKIYQNGTFVQDVVITTAVQTYLDNGDYSVLSIDDTTYIASRNVVTKMASDVHTYQNNSSIVQLLGGQYGRTFTVTVTWGTLSVSASYTTPNGGSSSDITSVSTIHIATQLQTALNAISTNSFNTLFTVERVEDTIWIHSSSVSEFNITVADGEGGTLIKGCNNSVESTSDVPRYAPNGYLVTVSGLGAASEDDYYLQFLANEYSASGTFGKAGTWYESVAPNLPYKFDNSTMPVGLQRNSSTGVFTLGLINWPERECGDDSTNPIPSFVNHKINDLAYFQGRMVLISDPAVVLSRTSTSANSSKVTDFWRETASQSTDSDVIDMQSTASGVGALQRVIPHNRDLIIFAEGAQFIIIGRNALTPSNCSLIMTTTFKCDLTAEPIETGRNVFFAEANGDFTNIREFYTLDSIDANDSRPITQHCSQYITGGLKQFVGSSNYDVLLVLTKSVNMFVYEYLWNDSSKVQSSWSKWILPFEPVRAWMEGDNVLFIRKTLSSGSTHMYQLYSTRLDVQSDTGLSYCVHLDNKMAVTVTSGTCTVPNFDPGTDYTDLFVFVQGTGMPNPGMRILPTGITKDTSQYTVTFPGTFAGTVYCGTRYTSKYRPSMPVIKDQDEVAIGTGKFSVQRFILNCVSTGKLWYRKVSEFRVGSVSSSLFLAAARFTNDPRAVVGQEAIVTKQFLIPFRDDPSYAELELVTDEHTPLTINNLEWLGEYNHSRVRMQGNK